MGNNLTLLSTAKRDELVDRAAYAEVHLELFEQLLCAMAFDKGVLVGVIEHEDEQPEFSTLRLTRLADLPSPGISAIVQATPPRLVRP